MQENQEMLDGED